jgi:thiol-disulfide isomerase/thioredoxin
MGQTARGWETSSDLRFRWRLDGLDATEARADVNITAKQASKGLESAIVHGKPRIAMIADWRVLRLAIVAALTLVAGIARAEVTPAPDIQLRTARGTTVRLSDLKGKVVLVDFWASWCRPCVRSFPAIDGLYRKFRSRGLEVLAVNMDQQRRDADAFLSRVPHAMRIFFDTDGHTLGAFALGGIPSLVLIDRSGNVRIVHAGYSDRIGDEVRPEIELLLSETP